MSLSARVKALPPFVNRIENAVINRGEYLSGFNVWPSARPRITLQTGERFTLSLRIRPEQTNAGHISKASSEDGAVPTAVRYEKGDRSYWVDIIIPAAGEPGQRSIPVKLAIEQGIESELSIALRISVTSEGTLVTPRTLDLGEMSLGSGGDLSTVSGRIGVRKQLGGLHLGSVKSTVPFLKTETLTIVEGVNYVVRISLEPGAKLTPGSITGSVIIETDDPERPRIEIPVRLRLVP